MLIVLEAGGLRSGYQHGTVQTSQCNLKGQKGRPSFWGLFYKGTNPVNEDS